MGVNRGNHTSISLLAVSFMSEQNKVLWWRNFAYVKIHSLHIYSYIEPKTIISAVRIPRGMSTIIMGTENVEQQPGQGKSMLFC